MLLLAPIIALLLSQTLWLVMGRPRFLLKTEKATETPRISIIIPARNEEHNLPKLLDSFQASKAQPYEIIVVDDGSTDNTNGIAQERNTKVIQPAPLPEEWKGKPWACQEGSRHADGDWLLFLDSDVWFEEDGFEKLLPLTSSTNVASSICPYHKIGSITEELSSFFNLIMVAGSNAFGLPVGTRENSALFGQSLLISKQAYEQVEGHSRVKNEILENFHLAEHLKKENLTRNCYLGKGVLSMRMFSQGLPELWQSWKKGFTSGAKQVEARALFLISLWLTAGMTILPSLIFLAFPSLTDSNFQIVTAFAYLIFAGQCAWAFRQVGNFSLLNALLFPISLIFYQALFFTALLEKKRGIQANWKGRDVS